MSSYKGAFLRHLVMGVAVAGLSPAASLAASGDFTGGKGKADTSMGDIIVTARRTEERLQDVPISITVFNQQKLADANIVSSGDLARITPSLTVNNNYGSDNTTFAIRGFIQETSTAPSVGVYFADVVAPRGAANGTPAGDGAGPGSFFDLQNVQVLKGPQGTLFGRNTTGGDVLLVPQKPTSQFGGYVEASYGNYDMRRLQAVVNLPINNFVRMRLGVDDQIRDGYLNNKSGIGPSHLDNVDYTAFRGSLVVDLLPNLENYTIGSLSHSTNYGDVQKMLAGPGSGALGAIFAPGIAARAAATSGFYDVDNDEAHPESKMDAWQIINTTTWKATDNLTVKNIISYAQLKTDTVSSLFGVAIPVTLPSGSWVFPFTEIDHVPGGDTSNQKTFTEELQFQGNALDNRLTWQGGGYVEAALPVGTVGSQGYTLAVCTDAAGTHCTDPLGQALANEFGLPYIPVGSSGSTTQLTYFHDLGIYGQGTYKLTDQFKLTAGYRYTWDRESTSTHSIDYMLDYPPNYGFLPVPGNPRCTQPQTVPTGCISNLYQESNAPTWLLDLDYTPSDDLLVYAKYSRGYRAGGIAANIVPPLSTFQAEHVNTYEAGLKSTFHAPVKGTFDVAAFYNDFTNQQIQLGFGGQNGNSSTAAPVNAGTSKIYGVEVNAAVNPFEGLVIDVGYTYLNTDILKVKTFDTSGFTGPNAPYILSSSFHPGDPIALTPANKAVVDVNYTLPLSPTLGKISVGATFAHTDRALANYGDRYVTGFQQYSWLPATDILDLNASWKTIYGSPMDASFFATNVNGDKYYTFLPGVAGAGFGFESAELGQPTMYGVRLKYHF